METLTNDAVEIVTKGYQIYCEKHSTIPITEYLERKLLNKTEFSKLLETSEINWITTFFDDEELQLIRSKYVEKRHFFQSVDAIQNQKFKISVLKNSAAEVFVQKEFDLIDLRAQPFKVIFCANTKLDRPEWHLISHRRTWCKHDKPYLNKKYGVIVTLAENDIPKIAVILDRTTINKYAVFSQYTDHIIIHKKHYTKAVLEFDDVLAELNREIILQTHIEQKTLSAINRLRKAYFSELKNAQDIFEIIVDFYHANYSSNLIQKQLQHTIEQYRPTTSRRLLRYCRTTRNKIHELTQQNLKIEPEILARTAFNNPHYVQDWYLNHKLTTT